MPRFDQPMQAEFIRADLLEKLRKNRDTHASIVAEARVGYIERARKAIGDKLCDLQSGKVVELQFQLFPPVEHLDEYDTIIQMLEMAQGKNITLTAGQFRQFVMDEWDWSYTFFSSNKAYSATANSIAENKGL